MYKRKTAVKAAAQAAAQIAQASGDAAAQGCHKSVGGVVTGAELVAAQKAAPGKEAVEALMAREAVEDAANAAEDVASIAKVGAKIAKGGVVTGAVGGLVLGSVAGNAAQAAAGGKVAAIMALGQGGEVGAKIGAAGEVAKASTSNSDVMKSLAGEKDFLEAGAELAKAIASAQDWEPVVGNVATVAQQSRAR